MRKSMVPLLLVGVVVGMVGVAFAAPTLYARFCSATGYAGTPQIGPAASPGAVAQKITVRFDADTHTGLPWQFGPDQQSVTLSLGAEQIATYHATNEGVAAITGVALYNVTPETVGKYFHKTACFCFNEQTLQPGQSQRFPLTFWVDPAIASDPDTADIHTITLSYTFFRSLDDAARSGALAKAGPHIGAYTGAALAK